MDLSYDPAISLLGIFSKDMNNLYQGDICNKFIAAQFIIAKIWSQLRYHSSDKWIKKMW